MSPLILTSVGDGAAIMVSHGVISLVVTSTDRRSTGGSLSRNGVGTVRRPFVHAKYSSADALFFESAPIHRDLVVFKSSRDYSGTVGRFVIVQSKLKLSEMGNTWLVRT